MRRRPFPLAIVGSAFVVATVLGACGGGPGAGDGTSGIAGTVTIGPTCPVQRADSPCPPAPFDATVTIHDGNDVVATGRSGTDGTFRIPVEPGYYTVTAEPVQPNPITHAQPIAPVTVTAGAFAHVDISFDSGIR